MSERNRREFLAGAASLLAAAALPGASLLAGQTPRFDLVITGGRVIDPANGIDGIRDVGILGTRIGRVAERIPPDQARQSLNAAGKIVTPGLIDSHVHCYEGVANVGIDADQIGLARGVTGVIDAGSAGATTFPGFRQYVASRARTRVYALINISGPGMTIGNETADLAFLDPDACARAIAANRDVIVGVKVRMLAGIPAGQDVEVMRRARAAADLAGVPIVVHIGGQTSPLTRIVEQLRPGDVITHAFRRDGSILDGAGKPYPEVMEAVARGVNLDIGHGRGNLDFDVAERALAQGILPTTISSDVHRGNSLGPVFDLPTTLSKFMEMGMTLPQVIERATSAPARIYPLGLELGTLTEGAAADVALFEVTEGRYEFTDSGGKRRAGTQRLVPYAALRDGRPFGSINP